MKIGKLSLEKIGQQLAGRKPTPGGGVAAALTGGLATSLVVKITNFSLEKKESGLVQDDLKKIAKEGETLFKQFQELADRDISTYQGFLKDKKDPERIRKLIEVPLEVARLSLRVLELANFLAEKGNQNLVSDSRVALELATAAFYSGLETARASLPYLNGLDFEEETRDKIEDFLEEVRSLIG